MLDGPDETTDAKSNLVNYSQLTIDDSPVMWVMYTPKMTGAIDIPLESCPWHWGGTLTWNVANKVWTFANASPAAAGAAGSGSTDKYPEWSQILSVPTPPL